ncbi:MAG: putative ribonuclease [Osedax symbiont Rs1]|nr:MAG: putative ribonuclease [Osedax symbiont Rs1]
MKHLDLSKALHFMRTLVKQFSANGGLVNASALTYTTLFAVVPLMTVTYAVLAMVPAFQGVGESVQSWVFSNFVPATGEVVQDYLTDFTSQARRLTAVGALFLFVTSVMMMKNIEAAFNRIWRVKNSRKGISSFLLYWAVLSLGPILIGVGLLASSYLASLPFISEATAVFGRGNLLSLLPLALSIAAFSLLYSAVPNCRVPFKNAFIGAVVVALLFEVAKRAFALFAVQFPSYELIYGAFAAVPLFLAWIFITWMIILFGAELSRLLTVYNSAAAGGFQSNFHTIIGILQKLWLAQREGKTLSADALLAKVAGLDQKRWDEYQQLLLENGIVCRSEQGEYLLARDLNNISLEQLREVFPWPIPKPSTLAEPCETTNQEAKQPSAQVSQIVVSGDWVNRLDNKLAQVREEQGKVLAASVQSLFIDH